MMIKINDKEFSKVALLKLIGENKIQAIMHLRSILKIGLKEAKEIIDNLEENPDYYSGDIEVTEQKEFIEEERIIVEVKAGNNNDMYIIDGEYVAKEKLLRLIKQSKLEAIKFLKNLIKIGLKDSKEIIDNLAENPDYYEDNIIKTRNGHNKEIEESSITNRDKNASKRGSHFIEEDASKKRQFLFYGVILIVAIIVYLFLR